MHTYIHPETNEIPRVFISLSGHESMCPHRIGSFARATSHVPHSVHICMIHF